MAKERLEYIRYHGWKPSYQALCVMLYLLWQAACCVWAMQSLLDWASSGHLGFIVVLLHFNVELPLVRLLIDWNSILYCVVPNISRSVRPANH